MRFKSKIVLVAGCICLLSLSVPALGLPKQKGAEKHAQLSRNAKVPQTNAKNSKTTKSKITQRVLKVQAKARHAREARAARLVSMPIAETPKRPMFGWPTLVSEARKYMGTNPTSRSRLWCATFMNMVLAKAGYSGTNSDAAKSFAQYGHRINEPQVGAIAVLTRGKNGGHVGVVSGVDNHGNPIIISGNHGKRVGEAIYPRSRVIAYVMPSGERGEPTTQLAARSQSSERRAPSDGGFESPIAELIAAIEAEQSRSDRPVRVSAQAQMAQARAPEPRGAGTVTANPRTANPRTAMRAGTLPLDPALAELLGISEKTRARAQAPAPLPQAAAPQVAPQPAAMPRQRQVQQVETSGRIASALPVGSFR
jgi:uncharacterized protein (TIGR02594 family)